MQPSKWLSKRIQKLQQILQSKGYDACICTDPYDLYYLTHLKLSCGHLFVGQKQAALFVDGRYFEVAKKNSPVPVHSLEKQLQSKWLKNASIVCASPHSLTHSQFLDLRKLCKSAGSKLVADSSLFTTMRLIKGEEELVKMRASAAFAYRAYQEVRKKLKPGISESELAKELEIWCLKNGADAMSFEPIIAFGENTALPHHHPSSTLCRANDIVLFDLGVVLDSYCSDMTRVDFVGKVNPHLKKIFEVNHAAQKAALAKCRPGIRLKELDEAARSVMRKEGLEQYFVHSLGHGIGLQVHEAPRISKTGVDKNLVLEAGMVITIEPGIYLPGKGGVRYEDTVAITHEGVENFYPGQ